MGPLFWGVGVKVLIPPFIKFKKFKRGGANKYFKLLVLGATH